MSYKNIVSSILDENVIETKDKVYESLREKVKDLLENTKNKITKNLVVESYGGDDEDDWDEWEDEDIKNECYEFLNDISNRILGVYGINENAEEYDISDVLENYINDYNDNSELTLETIVESFVTLYQLEEINEELAKKIGSLAGKIHAGVANAMRNISSTGKILKNTVKKGIDDFKKGYSQGQKEASKLDTTKKSKNLAFAAAKGKTFKDIISNKKKVINKPEIPKVPNVSNISKSSKTTKKVKIEPTISKLVD